MDIDIAIREDDYAALGIGSGALGLLIRELVAENIIPLIMLCTSVDNAMAIRAFEKVCFFRQSTFFEEGLDDM